MVFGRIVSKLGLNHLLSPTESPLKFHQNRTILLGDTAFQNFKKITIKNFFLKNRFRRERAQAKPYIHVIPIFCTTT